MDATSLMDPSQKPAANLREKAYDRFTHHLLARDIRAGQFISQRELAALTGLPLGAIRELVPRLEAEKLIRTAPQRGMQVAYVDLNLVRDAFQYRLFLEREAVALFTTDAADSVIERLRRDHADIIAACENAQVDGGIPAELIGRAQAIDWSLHATIVDFLGNAIIADAYRVNAIKIRLIKQEQTRLNDVLVIPTMKEHVAIIEAIASRDPAKAAAALGHHIVNARNRAMNLL